jgi:hypothetical protein
MASELPTCVPGQGRPAPLLTVVNGTFNGMVILVFSGWLGGLRGSAFHGPACALASGTGGSFVAASLRNAATRPKVSPMVWPAR